MAGGRQGQLERGVWALGHLRVTLLQAAVLCVVGLGHRWPLPGAAKVPRPCVATRFVQTLLNVPGGRSALIRDKH